MNADKIEKQLETINKKIDAIPLKGGHVDFANPEFKRLSNKRAKLYEKIRESK